ncbi:MAG: Brp/Blh family beta-carotene 15,15'-dioxygenase [Rubrobacter sp.]|nr:Brp/Blh family beta-carotene 15,15'-dioxygenase [Rubrobacter sp.]
MSVAKATQPSRLSYDLVPWISAATATVCAVIFDSSLSDLSFLPWTLGLVLFGLPHGACDHLVASKLTGRRSMGDVLSFVVFYLGAAAVVFVLWMADATLALALFLALTAWHWGSADAAHCRVEGLAPFFIASVARGALVISAPVAFHQEQSLSAFVGILSVFREAPAWNAERVATLAVAGLLLSVIAEASIIFSNLLRPRAPSALRGAVETLLLIALFSLVSPVAAVGVYFVFWHAWRHVLRVSELLEEQGSRRETGLASTLVGYHAKALPLTLLTLALLLVLTLVSSLQEPQQLLGIYIVLISALTVPHAALISIWDIGTDALDRRWDSKTGS